MNYELGHHNLQPGQERHSLSIDTLIAQAEGAMSDPRIVNTHST